MTVLDRLSQNAVKYISGVPWSSFTRDPHADVYGEVKYYLSLAQQMRDVMAFAGEIDWTWDVYQRPDGDTALAAWYGVRDGVLSKDSAIMAGLDANAKSVSGPSYELEVWRAFVSRMFASAMQGFTIHKSLLLQLGRIDPAVIVNNADKVHALCMALKVLNTTGLLNRLRKNQVGAVPVAVAVIIAVGSVAALSVIGWYIVQLEAISSQYTLANQVCERAVETRDARLLEACAKAQDALKTVVPQKGPWDAVGTVATFAGVGILIWAFMQGRKGSQ